MCNNCGCKEAESFDAEYDEEDMVYCNHCSDIVGNEKEVYGDETVDYEMANGELVCVPCYKIWMKEYENDLDPNYSPFYAESFDAESFEADVYVIESGSKTEMSFQELFDYLNSAIDDEYFLTKKERDDYFDKFYSYDAESFEAESNFDKLANKIAAQYRKKGKSAKEAMRIGKATAYKIGARKYGKAGMARKARAGMRAEGFEGESPMMKNITAIGVLALAILAGKKLTR